MEIHILDPTVSRLHRPNVSFIYMQSVHGITVTILLITYRYLSSNQYNNELRGEFTTMLVKKYK